MFEGRSIQRVVLLPVLLVFFFFASCETQKKVEITPRDFDRHIQNELELIEDAQDEVFAAKAEELIRKIENK